MAANPQLLSYIKEALVKGHSEREIKNSLLSSGWPKEKINLAIAEVKGLRPLGFKTLYQTTFSQFKKIWKPLVIISVIDSIASFCLGMILRLLLPSYVKSVPSRYVLFYAYVNLTEKFPDAKWLAYLVLLLYLGAVFVVTQTFIAVYLLVIKNKDNKEFSLFKDCFLEVRKYIWSLVSLGLLFFLALAIGVVLLIVPALIVFTFLFLYPYAVVLEDKKGILVFKRIIALVKKGGAFNIFVRAIIGNLLGRIPLVGQAVSHLYFATLFENLKKGASFR